LTARRDPLAGTRACGCHRTHATPRLVAVTGGPGAGKTAVLEVARRHFCSHVVVLPEAATILYGSGFPRLESASARKHAQIAVLHVQDQMERIEMETGQPAVVLCDRSVLDGLAYWPGDEPSYLEELGLTRGDALARYAAVLHLRPPRAGHGYDPESRVRIESPDEAAAIDARIERAYEGHPVRQFVESTDDFVTKMLAAIGWLEQFVPSCCRRAAA
jgi:predicted ATPase